MHALIGPCWPTPIPELSERFDLGAATIDTAFPAGFYEHPLLFLQAIDDDVLIKFSTTADEDAGDDDFLVPEGSTIIIGRPEGTSGMYMHVKSKGGQTGELIVHAGDLRACGVVNYDMVQATLAI
jgi:hypothetical protein